MTASSRRVRIGVAPPVDGVCAVAIEGACLGESSILRGEEPTVRVHQVISQIEEARRAGSRVLLLSVDCLGGSSKAGLALYDALRSFSDAGGFVVAYVQVAASAASLFTLAADAIVAAPEGSAFVFHGVEASAAGREWTSEVARLNAVNAAVLCARSMVPVEEAEKWGASLRGHVVLSGDAVALGLADLHGTREEAAALAKGIAGGAAFSSARRTTLAQSRRFEAEERQARKEGRYAAECFSLRHARAVKRLHNFRRVENQA